MEKQKIRILFYNVDMAGVNYFRSLTPATQLDRDHSDDFYVEINNQIDFNNPQTIDYLKSFDIIHYHRQLLPNTKQMLALVTELRKTGTKFIMDLDDFWDLPLQHPYYSISKEQKLHIPIIENLKIADYVTTTTKIFANEIRKITGKDNVIILSNSVDPEWMKQFQNNWKPDPDGRVRIVYMAGSSHLGDLEQLTGVFNVLHNDPQLKDKFKIVLSGWDSDGNTTDIIFNQEFAEALQKRGLWSNIMVKAINKSKGNVDLIPNIPTDLKEQFRNKIFNTEQRPIKSEESVYLAYENILTDNHKIIEDKEYLNWLNNFERNVKYPNEGNFGRVWTQKANIYATALDNCDIVIAPLEDNKFNQMKCVTESTLISTNVGIFKIKDLVDDSKLNIKTSSNEIINYFKYPNEKVIKLVTEFGHEIEGTHTHRIMVNNEWKELKDFIVGDKINLVPFEIESKEYQRIYYPLLLSKKITKDLLNNSSKDMMPSILINEDYGRFFGYMLGDGHFSTSYLRISCDKRYDDVVDDIVGLTKKMGLSPFLINKTPDKRCNNSLVKEGFGIDISMSSKHFADICFQENLRNEKGKVFEVPHFILKSPKSVIREFLRGLFEADGTVMSEMSSMSLTTKSIVFAKQIQYLLLGFGIVGKIDHIYNKHYNRYYYVLRLNRDASDIFYFEIGFVSKMKQDKLKLITKKDHSNRFEQQSFNTTVKSIEYSNKDVYDIEVNDIHSYNGNGVINHNSNLKMVECWTRKLPIVCSDLVTYNVDGKHMENCILIPTKKNARKDWQKYLKKLILDKELRERLGNQLHEDFKEKYNLRNITEKRAEFYKSITDKNLNK